MRRIGNSNGGALGERSAPGPSGSRLVAVCLFARINETIAPYCRFVETQRSGLNEWRFSGGRGRRPAPTRVRDRARLRYCDGHDTAGEPALQPTDRLSEPVRSTLPSPTSWLEVLEFPAGEIGDCRSMSETISSCNRPASELIRKRLHMLPYKLPQESYVHKVNREKTIPEASVLVHAVRQRCRVTPSKPGRVLEVSSKHGRVSTRRDRPPRERSRNPPPQGWDWSRPLPRRGRDRSPPAAPPGWHLP